MANARSRKRKGLTRGGVIFIRETKKKSKHKYLEMPFFVNFSDESTPESRASYWKSYNKQRTELSKNRKYSRQSKGIQKPYKIHHMITNLMDFSY